MISVGDWVQFYTWNEMVKQGRLDKSGDILLNDGVYFTLEMKSLCGLIGRVADIIDFGLDDCSEYIIVDNPVIEKVHDLGYGFTASMFKKVRKPEWIG